MEKSIKDQVTAAFDGATTKRKYWALMLFNTELELGVSNKPNKWVNTANRFYTNGTAALEAYANTPNPASQLIDALSEEELVEKMQEMLVNYSDEKWLDENLYPFL